MGCSNQATLTIGENVTCIPQYAFREFYGLTSVTIPNTVTNIGTFAFYDCSALTSVNYTGTVAQWCNILFNDYYSNPIRYSHSLNINGSLISSLVIPDSVTSISNYAFYYCNSITEIHSETGVAPLLGDNSFENVPTNIPVYIPCGSITSYNSRWSYFSNIIEDVGFSFSAASVESTQGNVVVLTEPTCQDSTAVVQAVANSGYLFDHWSTGSTMNPYSLTVTSDTVITAFFVADSSAERIDDINVSGGSVYGQDGQIVVEGADGNSVTLYDVNGRMLATKRDDNGPLRFDVPASGTYMIKIGNYPARKVAVVR